MFKSFPNTIFQFLIVGIFSISCASTLSKENEKVEIWLTNSDESAKLQKQNSTLFFTNSSTEKQIIQLDEAQVFQTIDGFGYTLTGGSVEVINTLSKDKKQELLQELFGKNENSIGVSFIRISIGASDLNSTVFSYNDLPLGETDPSLSKFSLSLDQPLIDLLKEILVLNPSLKIIATPWSAPIWMKDNASYIGGSLKPEFYQVYANYFVKYIQEMKVQGIAIHSITPQNEPLNPNNNPSMVMTSAQQNNFIKNYLGPAFQKANISTKIVVFDHNCNRPDYAISILEDKETNPFVDGSAFHLYEGEISALSTVHNAFPKKNIYFTEQWTGSDGTFSGDFQWHIKNVIIGSIRNWSKTALEWNLANDSQFKPHTNGGCTQCKGALTIANNTWERNVGYYIIAQISKFVPPNSVRISSTEINKVLGSVAFRRSDGKIVLLVQNESNSKQTFAIQIHRKFATTTLDANSVATYIF